MSLTLQRPCVPSGNNVSNPDSYEFQTCGLQVGALKPEHEERWKEEAATADQQVEVLTSKGSYCDAGLGRAQEE